ncbi:MAG TPA: ABC transporter substrate-binding protein [Thermoleophilia bacterium]|nr:ABC transporter substrate-binding protein [Thermoleophilia bacterium]
MTRSRPVHAATGGAFVAVLVLVFGFALLLAACGGSSNSSSNSSPSAGGGETVTLWHGYTDVERTATDQAIQDFNATNPGFTMKSVFAGNNDYALTKLQTALAAGKAPDISYQYGSSMALLAKLPQVVDLTSRVNEPSFGWNDFFPAERLATTVNGKVLGVPALVDNLAIVYNKKLFDQAGVSYPTADWTWTDFRDAAKKLTNPAAKQFGWAYVNDGSEDTVWRFLALLWQSDGDLLNADNTKAAFNSPAGLAAMNLLHNMSVVDKSIYLDSGNGNYLNLFNAGKIAMLWTGPWDISSINKGVDFGVQILPGNPTHATIAGPDNYVVINNGSQRVNDAWSFIKWFTSPKEHLNYAIQTGHLPIRAAETKLPEYKSVYLKKFPSSVVFVANLNNVTKARPNIPTYPKVSSDLGQAVQGVLLGKLSPQQALQQAEQQVNSDLAAGQ